tara:strand:- start:386 stop:643 length:258 start_codon:yes stop_codon:yes gene_type:complete
MKLYELGNDKRFTLTEDDSGTVFLLDHIDGAYSVCTIGNAVVHIEAFAEIVEVVKIPPDFTDSYLGFVDPENPRPCLRVTIEEIE